MDIKLLWKSVIQALKWFLLSWFCLALVSAVGVFLLIQSELSPIIFKVGAGSMYIVMVIIFYRRNVIKSEGTEKTK